jgi:hypothetical protein
MRKTEALLLNWPLSGYRRVTVGIRGGAHGSGYFERCRCGVAGYRLRYWFCARGGEKRLGSGSEGRSRRCSEAWPHDEQQRALAELEASPDDPAKRAVVTEYVRRDVETDAEFAARLASLVAAAQSHNTGPTLIAQATGNAKQANFGEDNFGSITFS